MYMYMLGTFLGVSYPWDFVETYVSWINAFGDLLKYVRFARPTHGISLRILAFCIEAIDDLLKIQSVIT